MDQITQALSYVVESWNVLNPPIIAVVYIALFSMSARCFNRARKSASKLWTLAGVIAGPLFALGVIALLPQLQISPSPYEWLGWTVVYCHYRIFRFIWVATGRDVEVTFGAGMFCSALGVFLILYPFAFAADSIQEAEKAEQEYVAAVEAKEARESLGAERKERILELEAESPSAANESYFAVVAFDDSDLQYSSATLVREDGAVITALISRSDMAIMNEVRKVVSKNGAAEIVGVYVKVGWERGIYSVHGEALPLLSAFELIE